MYWPYDLLAKHPDLSQTRIMTYGYDSLVTKFFDANNKQNISMHGNDLMVALEQERKSSVLTQNRLQVSETDNLSRMQAQGHWSLSLIVSVVSWSKW